MKKLHNKLLQHSRHYRTWHEHPLHRHVHWGLLGAVVLGVALSFVILGWQEQGAFYPVQAQSATIYYVAPNGSDSNPGTIDQPWVSLQKAHGVLQPGDTLYIRGGTYTQQPGVPWFKSGEQGKPITIKAYPGETPVFDGTNYAGVLGARSTPEWTILFPIFRADYLIFDGLTIHTYFDAFNVVGDTSDKATHITIRNCHIYSTTSHGIYFRQNVEDVEVSNCIIRDISRGEHFGDSCIVGWHDPGVQRAKIYNNILMTADNCILFADGARDIDIYNNVFYDNTIGIHLWYGGAGGEPEDVKNVTIRNNIFYANKYVMAVRPANYDEVHTDYNIWYQPEDVPVIARGYNDSFKLYSLAEYQAETGNGANSLQIDPMFVDPNNYDFRLSSNSPAIDAGTSQNAPSTDFEGTPRPQGSAWDIGADEYGAGSPRCTPSPEVCDQKDNDCDGDVDEGNVCGTTNQPPRNLFLRYLGPTP